MVIRFQISIFIHINRLFSFKGTVYKAKPVQASSTGRPSSAALNRPIFYAIKCIYRKSLTKSSQDLLINEIKILKQIKHENIVEMYDFKVEEEKKCVGEIY